MTVLSAAVCTGLWDCVSNCWPIVVAAFVGGSWFGLMVMGLLLNASQRADPVGTVPCSKCQARLAGVSRQ